MTVGKSHPIFESQLFHFHVEKFWGNQSSQAGWKNECPDCSYLLVIGAQLTVPPSVLIAVFPFSVSELFFRRCRLLLSSSLQLNTHSTNTKSNFPTSQHKLFASIFYTVRFRNYQWEKAESIQSLFIFRNYETSACRAPIRSEWTSPLGKEDQQFMRNKEKEWDHRLFCRDMKPRFFSHAVPKIHLFPNHSGLAPNPRCPTDVPPGQMLSSQRCNPSKLLSGLMHFVSDVQLFIGWSVDVATLVSSKTRSVQTGLSQVLHWSAPPPAEGGGSNQVSRPLSRSMGGERDANLFCGSYSAWGTQSVNPLSRPGHKCARCNKDYGARVFEEEDRD